MVNAVITFFSSVGAAISVKIISSIDDVLWLSSFLTPDHPMNVRLTNSLVYTAVCMAQTFLAFIISTGGEQAIDKIITQFFGEHSISTDKFLTLLSGSALAIYSIMLVYEYCRSEILGIDDDDKEACKSDKGYESIPCHEPRESDIELKGMEGKQNASSDVEKTNTDETATTESSDESQFDNECEIQVESFESEHTTTREKNESKKLIVIAFLGSLDDLTLFVPLLVGKTFHILELIIGAFIATCIILLICFFLVKCKLVAEIIQSIPLCAIVIAFSLALIVKGLLMD